MIKAVLFDLDGTLIDRDTTVRRFIEDQYARYNITSGPLETYRARFLELDHRGYGDKHTVWSTLAAEFGIEASVEELLRDFRANASRFSALFPQTEEVLRDLRTRGYKLGMITNGTVQLQSAKINVTGLSALVDVVLISEQEGIRKPEREIFARAAQRLGVALSECMFVGDNPRADVVGAHEAGMKAVWFAVNQEWPSDLEIEPPHVVSSAEDVVALVS